MKIKKGSTSYSILKALGQAAKQDLLENLSYSAQMKHLRNAAQLSAPIQEASFVKSVYRLKKSGLIEDQSNADGEFFLKLTELGSNFLEEDSPWDGIFRFVIWDIPEVKRGRRDVFRRKLKEWQFKNIQKSVWVSKRNVTRKLRDLIHELDMDRWVIVLESSDPTLADRFSHDRD